jgi:hypothetical protein
MVDQIFQSLEIKPEPFLATGLAGVVFYAFFNAFFLICYDYRLFPSEQLAGTRAKIAK